MLRYIIFHVPFIYRKQTYLIHAFSRNIRHTMITFRDIIAIFIDISRLITSIPFQRIVIFNLKQRSSAKHYHATNSSLQPLSLMTWLSFYRALYIYFDIDRNMVGCAYFSPAPPAIIALIIPYRQLPRL